jgi:hydrogenase expression/formation protein HypE
VKRVDLSIGSGGKSMRDFIEGVVLKHLGGNALDSLHDSAIVATPPRIAFTTDSFVIQPLFFPGGDIGKLSIAGTVNDLVVSGARPLYVSLALILEEGFQMEHLGRVLESVRETARVAGVEVVTGDTKVVRKGEADGLYINTAGIGALIRREDGMEIREGDVVIVTGSPGDHGVAVMVARHEFAFEGDVRSDCAPLVDLLPLWEMDGVKWMRDITRGGLATVICELAGEIGLGVLLEEARVPFSPPVRAVAEILGIEPLYLPSEGKAIVVASAGAAGKVLDHLHGPAMCPEASAIGVVQPARAGAPVVLKTVSGGYRVLESLTGELLPRIC